MIMNLSCTDTEIRGFKNFGVTSLIFWGHVIVIDHVTIGLGVGNFLLMVNDACIRRYGASKILGSRV